MSDLTLQHRIDIILPDNRSFFLPLTSDLTGGQLVSFLDNSLNYERYVICRNSPNDFQYEVLYSCDTLGVPESSIISESSSGQNFVESPIQKFFYPDRTITTKTQRMAFFVFCIDEFQIANSLLFLKMPITSFIRMETKIEIIVRLPTRLEVTVSINKNQTVKTVKYYLHQKLLELYPKECIRPKKYYNFLTIHNFMPESSDQFDQVPELMAAYRRQRLDNKAQFLFEQARIKTDFSIASENYTKQLDLLPVTNNNETQMLNSTLSNVRSKIDTERLKKLTENPLLARMRLSETDPPLTASTKQFILMKAILQSALVDQNTTSVSIKIEINKTADQAIEMLFNKMQTYQNVGMDLNEKDFVLVIQGTDEVICGPTILKNFVYIRHFLISTSTHIMSFLLINKEGIINSIKSRELSSQPLPEPTPDQKYKAIRITQPPTAKFNIMPAYPHTVNHEHLSLFISCCVNIGNNIKTSKQNNSKIEKRSVKSKRMILSARLFNGGVAISEPVRTKPACGSSSVIFNEVLILKLQINAIPRSARVSMTLYDYDRLINKKHHSALSTFNSAVFTFDGWLNCGHCVKRMWNGRGVDPILTTCESEDPKAIQIFFAVQDYKFPISFCEFPHSSQRMSSSIRYTDAMKKRLEYIQKMDPLQILSKEDKAMLFGRRYEYCECPEMLPHILASIDYTVPAQVQELPNILEIWTKPAPTEVLSLLDADFADPLVRKYAVDCLEGFTDDDIMLYMLQIVQALKYELYDDNPLVAFLFRRGLAEPKFLGHQLFWQLISEAHLSHIQKRFSSIVMNFLYGIGSYRDELLTGYNFTKQLVELNNQLCLLSHSEATEKFRDELQKLSIPHEFHLPMDPRLVVESFIIPKCKVMNSKKKPFWLTFKNADPFADDPVMTMFKVGDDLRQDQLTLQLMKVMEHMWRENGLDLQMRCYSVLPTGLNQGFIEVVPNSMTEAQLQQGRGTVKGVLDKELLSSFLRKENMPDELFKEACHVFKMSSAGYAVATCVLGVADRHPGNIMVQSDGHFFHIDFGHFLGNFKTKLGYQRENAPFHFSPACDYVIQMAPKKDNDDTFENLCGMGLNILRYNSKLLISLFLLMLGTGIPELQKPSDINYLKDKLFLDSSDEEATNKFAVLIKKSLDSTRTTLNNLFHNIKVSD
ncbi:Phosphatidylinositol 3- and 4-kinase family protein [Tritrichomonas foetus]|uniref:phosphatidylinositol 3-kinase n=1 Tax=Tritrichomonas foetus TaxID=1144522 RepID=A0A1J4J5W8_9EUKA|nr:Phosphatidylinositol 3- and 4-kinase family protein [Tritrichomonas foetus]|eukprot:OHS93043.1 Phosphatidylinositol 3- and 4-kinase family protein [Tritrichomonas foetus]